MSVHKFWLHRFFNKIKTHLLGIISVFFFVGCLNHGPVSEVSSDQYVQYNEVVTLVAKSWDADDDIVSETWTKVFGPDITISNISDTQISFTAPFTTKEQTFLFTFDVVDSKGSTSKNPVYVFVSPLIASAPLNDTGIIVCADFVSSDNLNPNPNNDIDCDLEYDNDGDIVPKPQDAHVGLDAIVKNKQGFDFTKLDQNGVELAVDATDFNCVKDNLTGLIWESKTVDSDLHDKLDSYTWYQDDSSINAGDSGDVGEATCFGYDENNTDTFCNSQAFTERVNQTNLCGLNNWRLPTKNELLSIVDFSQNNPAVNIEYFPNTHSHSYLSSNNSAKDGWENSIWYVYFNDGSWTTTSKDAQNRIRLVHDPITL